MHVKTFTAPTAAKAMALVREDLGEDAIIVSTQRNTEGPGIHIVAAEGKPAGTAPVTAQRKTDSALKTAFDGGVDGGVDGGFNGGPHRLDIYETVCRTLDYHGVPGPLTERLSHAAAALGASDPAAALAGAMDAHFSFSAIPSPRDAKPVMLIGPPGAGKTLTTAKLTARAVMAGQSVGVITADTKRAGAGEQLDAFMRVLKVDMKTATTPGELAEAAARLEDRDVVYIDTAAVNPYLDGDMAALGGLIQATEADPLVVLTAGGNALDTADMARAFADIGARRMVATRLDVTKRMGCLLAAADQSRLAFSGVSITPSVAKGLNAINAVSLARLIMPVALRDAPEVPAESPVAQNTPMAQAKRQIRGQTRGQIRAAS